MRMHLAFVGLLGLAACDATEPAKDQAAERPVLVAEIHYAPRTAAVELPGVVKARIESALGFRVAGKIVERRVDRGETVRAGDVLARLDDADLKLQLEAARAQRAAALAARDQTDAEQARVASLRKDGWSAASDFDRTRAAADQARAELDRAERSVALAQNALAYAALVADADGVVTSIDAEPGQVVAAGAPVVRIARAGAVEVDVAVPEALFAQARTGVARVGIWALPGVSVEARLRELSASADPASRTFAARYELVAPPKDVALGMSATLTLSPEAQAVAAAPIASIVDRGDGPSVWVVDRATSAATLKRVTLAGVDAAEAFIAGGVSEGERIVALGAQKIAPGEFLRAVDDFKGL